MEGFQRLVPSFDGSDDLIWIGGPGEGFGVFVGFGNEAIDGGLEIDEGMEDTPLEAPFCEFGEEAFDGVEPRGGCWREVENKPLVAIEPSPDLRMLMGGVVVEDDVDSLVRRDLSVDHVQEADELLVPVALHIAPDNRPVEDVQSGEKRRGSVTHGLVGDDYLPEVRQAGFRICLLWRWLPEQTHPDYQYPLPTHTDLSVTMLRGLLRWGQGRIRETCWDVPSRGSKSAG